jgi:ubiquinone/menaquinone biosynthesis C-methylase UbiE
MHVREAFEIKMDSSSHVEFSCTPATPGSMPAEVKYRVDRQKHWDWVASTYPDKKWGQSYHERLKQIYRFLVQPGQSVIELGCGPGDLLAATEPTTGVGVDLSGKMIERARVRHPHLRFVHGDSHDLQLDETFDILIVSDLINELWDVQRVFENIQHLCNPQTRIIVNTYSRLWQLPLQAVRSLDLAIPHLPQNWLTVEDIENLFYLTDYEVIRHWSEILLPLDIPGLELLCNRVLVKLLPFKLFALTNFVIARPRFGAQQPKDKPLVSVIIPARNEEGNIPEFFTRVPEMAGGTELIFVEGHSVDDTYNAISKCMVEHPHRRCKLLRQQGEGKGDAVRLGFDHAAGDVLIILDADLSVSPGDLPRFVEALISGKGEFVNGIRLVYPMEARAMRFLNLVGNKFFSIAFSWILGQSIKDTLCGTKALNKSCYDKIAANRSYFGDFDPFGDFDLIFGAAKLNLKIVDMPLRYRERTYGSTNIQRWKHGFLLLKMTLFSLKRIKFT